MRTSFVTVAGLIGLSLMAGCTEKVEPPSLAGPSTLARAITMTANRDTLFQNGVDFVDITITSTSPTGQAQAIPLRAEIMVGGVVQDFGTLSTKTPVTPATIRYTAPNASPNVGGQVAQEVTIVATPTDSGDFRAEVARQVTLRLVPQGIILPTNPGLTAAFTVTPASPQAFSTVSFDASTTTNGATACLTACSYAWNFGDGTSGSGMVTSHEYRTVGAVQVSLTVTDSRGAQNTLVRSVTVAASTPPTAIFLMSPTPVGINQDVFFNADQSRATLPRRITNYDWSFGDGRTGSGVTIARSFPALGSYTIVLTVTDDAGSSTQATQTLAVSEGLPTVTATASSLKVNGITQLLITATPATGATITNVKVVWGDETAPENGTSLTHTHKYTAVGTYTIVVTVTDSLGRTRSITVAAAVTV